MANLFDDFFKGSAPAASSPTESAAGGTAIAVKGPDSPAASGKNLFDSILPDKPAAPAAPAPAPQNQGLFPGVLEKARAFLASLAQKHEEEQAQEAAAQAQAQQEREARAQDPNFMSSSAFKKAVPKPATIEEQAIYDATLAKKKLEEKQLSQKLFPDSVTGQTPRSQKLPSGNFGLKIDPATGQPDQRPQIEPPQPGARPATSEENDQLSKQRTIQMMKEMPGDFDTAEAFFHGIVPYDTQGKDRMEAVDAAHPIAKGAGSLLGYAAAGVLTGGVAPAAEQMGFIQALPAFAKYTAGRIAATGAQFTLKSLMDSMAEQASGYDRSFGDIAKKALKDGAFGLGLGAAGSIPSPVLRIPFEAAYGFAAAKLQGADNFEAGINAALFGALGILNRENISKEFRKATIYGFKSATRDWLMEKGHAPEAAAKFASQYFDKVLQRSIHEEKPLTEDFIQEMTKRAKKATEDLRAFKSEARAVDSTPKAAGEITGPVAPEPAKPVQKSAAAAEPRKPSKMPETPQKEPLNAKKPAARRSPAPDVEKAIQAGDEASVIKGMGKFSFPEHLKGEIGKGQQYRKNMGKLFPFLRKDAQGLDSLLAELKNLAPNLFNKYDTDADLLRAILDDKLKKKSGAVNPEEKFQADYERHIEEVLQRDRQTEEAADSARAAGAEEEEIRAAQASAQTELESENESKGSRHNLNELQQEGVEVHHAFPTAEKKPTELSEQKINEIIARAGGEYIGRQPGFKKRSGEMTEGLVMFNAPSGTTLALKPSLITEDAVRAKLEESAAKEEAFRKTQENAEDVVDPREAEKTNKERAFRNSEEDAGPIKSVEKIVKIPGKNNDSLPVLDIKVGKNPDGSFAYSFSANTTLAGTNHAFHGYFKTKQEAISEASQAAREFAEQTINGKYVPVNKESKIAAQKILEAVNLLSKATDSASQAVIPGAEKPSYRKAEFGEGRALPEQREAATDLQQSANDYKQSTLFEGPQDYGTLFPEEEIAYGKENSAKKEAENLSREERNVKVVSPDGSGSTIWESPFALTLKETGKLSFPRRKISSPADIAFAFQSLKNDVQEHFYLGAIKNNQVVGVELLHIGAIDQSLVSIYEMTPLLQAYDADGYFMVHNHPSGRIIPSPEDINLTNKTNAALSKLGYELRGHVIINDSKFGFIDPDGSVHSYDHQEFSKTKDISLLKKYGQWKTSKDGRVQLSGPETVYEILKGIQRDPEKAVVFLLDKSNRIQSLVSVPAVNSDWGSALVKLAGPVRALSVILAGPKLAPKDISAIEAGLKPFSIKFLDMVFPGTDGNYQSAQELNIMREPAPEEYSINKNSSEEFSSVIKEPEDAEKSAESYQKQDDLFDPPADDTAASISYADPELMTDISGFKSGAMDAFRIFQEVFGKNYPVIVDRLLFPFTEANGLRVDMMKRVLDDLYKTVVKKYGIKKGSKESEAVQRFGEAEEGWLEHDLKRMFPNSWQNIIAADAWFRQNYDSLLDQVNSTLSKVYPGRTEKLIPKRKSYYRHFREFSSLGGLKAIFDTPANISSRLAGLSEFTKPKSKFLSFAQKRLGLATEVDAVGGFLDYLPAAAYAKHITPYIKEFRNLANFLRKGTEDTNHLNNFITYLDDYAGSLAGKTNPLDRLVVKYLPGGRKTMRLLNWINGRIKSNVILGNLSSALSQVFNVPQGIAEAKQYIFPGFVDVIRAMSDPSNPINNSSFIKARYSEKLLDRFDTGILSKTKDFLNFVMSAGDEMGTRFIWHSFYQKALGTKSSNPMQYADYMTRKMVAGRSVGEVALLQQSRLTQLVAPFQVEVGNLWWAMRDLVKKRDFAGILLFLIASYGMNEVAQKLRGSRVSIDLVNAMIEASQGDKTAAERVGRIAGEIASNVPLGQNLMSFYPEYGMKLPNGKRLPTREKFFGKSQAVRVGSGLLTVEGLKDPLTKLVLPFGGQQLKRSYDGVQAFRAGGYMSGKDWIQIEQSPKNFIKAVAFGKFSVPDKDSEELDRLKSAGEGAARRDREHRDQLRTYVQNAIANGADRRSILKGPYKEYKDRKSILEMFKTYKKKESAKTPAERTLLAANSNAEKIAILSSEEDKFKTLPEFNTFLSGLGRKKIINAKVANEARKSFKERMKQNA